MYKNVNYCGVVLTLSFMTINFFVSITGNAEKWYLHLPVFIVSLLYAMMINYETKKYVESSYFTSLFELNQKKFSISKLTF